MTKFINDYNKQNPSDPISIILTDELDRTARNQDFYWKYRNAMRDKGVIVRNMKIYYENNASGWYAEANAATSAEYQSRQNGERVFYRQMARMLD